MMNSHFPKYVRVEDMFSNSLSCDATRVIVVDGMNQNLPPSRAIQFATGYQELW